MKLVRDNYTTIENLEREDEEPSPWDIGHRRNLEQARAGCVQRVLGVGVGAGSEAGICAPRRRIFTRPRTGKVEDSIEI